jgi:hypothetical protein
VDSPLILTALLDPDAQLRFDGLRRAHFPPERNVLDAHVTLFHQLPCGQQAAIEDRLAAAADRAPIEARVAGLRLLGRGVAYLLDADELTALRARLARDWAGWLSRQDQHPTGLHVTVQNKVHPDVARALHARLTAGFVPQQVRVIGLGLWRYLGGPWEPVRRFEFRDQE